MEISMALKGQMSRTLFHAGILALDISLLFSISFYRMSGDMDGRRAVRFRESPLPSSAFELNSQLRGLYIENAVDLSVVQQPAGDTNFVSPEDGVVTQFASATSYGNIGLLAHNYLSGQSFSRLDIGHELFLVYEDGRLESFVVTEILRYQALDPKNPYSSFQNLDNQDEILTVGEMFDRAYQGDRHLTLQTCIAAHGNASWGRLFVIASPSSVYLSSTHSYSLERVP
jgi:hypothetical protein